MRLSSLLLAAALAMTAGVAEAAQQVRVGICVSWPGYSSYEIVKQKNLLPGYEIEQTIFEDPVGGHSALAAGQIDIYHCTGDYTPLIAERGTDSVEVAFTAPSFGVDHIATAPGIDAASLKGKKVAAPQAYIGQLLMGVWLDANNIAVEDVEWVNLNADEAVGPMMSGDLAAAYLYEPWLSKVTGALEGSKSAGDTSQATFLETGIFMDVIYMNRNFIAANRQAAKDMLKGHFLAMQAWHDDVAGANQIFADFLKWPKEDVEGVIGTNGKFLQGGVYIYDFDESARVCGVLEGDPPLGLKNGGILSTAALINDWWIKLGLMKEKVDVARAVDCSLMADLVKDGFRQSFQAN
jgi:NitT/TauT family transport system substrate-binding protein